MELRAASLPELPNAAAYDLALVSATGPTGPSGPGGAGGGDEALLLFWHYCCDGTDDRGWGCGYRSLQSIASALRLHRFPGRQTKEPSIPEIQALFVKAELRPPAFAGSRDWIGSLEVWTCLDWLFDVPCRILDLPSGATAPKWFDAIATHFTTFGTPLFVGGDADSMAKTLLGIARPREAGLPVHVLVMDPHFVAPAGWGERPIAERLGELDAGRWLSWRPWADVFDPRSIYNLCCPEAAPPAAPPSAAEDPAP